MTFLSQVAEIGQQAASFIVALFKALVEIFVTTTTTGEGSSAVTVTSLSIFGQLLLFSSSIGLGIWIIDWIRGLITVRRG